VSLRTAVAPSPGDDFFVTEGGAVRSPGLLVTARPSSPLDAPLSEEATTASWLAAFHAGERACLEGCYRGTFAAVYQTVGRTLQGADQETVVHEVFYRLLADGHLRRSFQGGSLAAWLRTVARNQAIDFARRRGFEIPVEKTLSADSPAAEGGPGSRLERQVEARLLLVRIREGLPEKWRPVFDARFIHQRDQPDAARSLRMSRTTLAYQEYRIRQRVRRYLSKGSGS
jgi:RNA polymerase sigma-70 factor (ECF subfamily)